MPVIFQRRSSPQYSPIAVVSSSGFSPASGFGFSGTIAENQSFTITRGAGGFGTKPNDPKPLLWMPMASSATPSSLGRVTSARATGQFTYSASGGADGNGCYVGDTSDGVLDNAWTIQLDSDSWASSTYDWNSYDHKNFVSYRYKKNFGDLDVASNYNVKHKRTWGRSGSTADAGAIQAPDSYHSRSNGRLGWENFTNSPYIDYDRRVYGAAAFAAGNAIQNRWYDEETLQKINSAATNTGLTTDEDYKWASDGGDYIIKSPFTTYDTFYLRSRNATGDANDGRLRRMFPVHMVVDAANFTITASMLGSVLTVTAVSGSGSNHVTVGCGVLGAGVPANTQIVSFGTGTGDTGTYNVSTSATVVSETMTTGLRPAAPYGSILQVDDLYVDDSWCRVVIGDSATYTSCTYRRLQPPSAWSDTSVTCTTQSGGITLSGKHVFIVTDADTPLYAGQIS